MRTLFGHGTATISRRRSWSGLLGGLLLLAVIGWVADPGADPDAEKPTPTASAASTAPPASVQTAPPSAGAPGASSSTAAPGTADQVADASAVAQTAAVLATLPTKGRAPQTGYSRDQFGDAWSDDVNVDGGHNGCDTRNDVLRRDLVDIVLKPGSNGCAVQSGTLRDPYTATTIAFVRGSGTSPAVQIDHIVALSDAWQKGAQQLTAQQRTDFANDPLNLQAVAGPANQAKGGGDAATWLPPNKAFRCGYVSRQVAVKARYGLWVTQAERDAIATVLAGCGATAVPATDQSTPAATPPGAQPPIPAPSTTPPPQAPSEVYYANCSAAEAAGAAPLHAGQPGYRPQLDGDRDGVACEK